jgi:hypothetical protein
MASQQGSADRLDILRLIQYAFPMVFVILALGFYINGQVPAIIAWVFAAVGILEYFLIGIIRISTHKTQRPA